MFFSKRQGQKVKVVQGFSLHGSFQSVQDLKTWKLCFHLVFPVHHAGLSGSERGEKPSTCEERDLGDDFK